MLPFLTFSQRLLEELAFRSFTSGARCHARDRCWCRSELEDLASYFIDKRSFLTVKCCGLCFFRYLHKPYLISGNKFDLRIYVYVTSYDPLRIYIFNDGLVRFASCKWVCHSTKGIENTHWKHSRITGSRNIFTIYDFKNVLVEVLEAMKQNIQIQGDLRNYKLWKSD